VKDSVPNSNLSKFLELSVTSQARNLIFGQQVNIDSANSRRYDVTQYIGDSKDSQSAHKCTAYILRSQVQVQCDIYAGSGSVGIGG